MPTKTIDILLNMQPSSGSVAATERGINRIKKGLQDIEKQANKTREQMQKLAAVGAKMSLVGGAIIAPFALAMKKYVDTTKETEPISKRLVELGKKWEESQVRIGRVTAEIVLPTLEKTLDIVDKIAAFAEKNPGAIKAAIGIGATLVVLGGLISTTAQIVSTIATIQGLAAGALGANATAAAGVTLGGGAAGAGLGASIAAAISAAAPFVAIAAAVVAASEATRLILNWLLGTSTTWSDIGTTLKQLFILAGQGWAMLFEKGGEWIGNLSENISNAFQSSISNVRSWLQNTASSITGGVGRFFTGLGNSIVNGFKSFGSSISTGLANMANAIRSFLHLPQKAEGGMTNGVSIAGERGREFVMSNRTTRAAESVIGGTLTQQRLLQGLAGNKRVSYYDARRFDSSVSANDRRTIRNETMLALSEALA